LPGADPSDMLGIVSMYPVDFPREEA